MEKQMNWAVLGTGVIANEMAQALQKMGKAALRSRESNPLESRGLRGEIRGGKSL